MKRSQIRLSLATAAALAVSAPAAAQMMNHANMPGMTMPGMKMPTPKKVAPKKKPVAKKPVLKKSAANKTVATPDTKRAVKRKSSAKRQVAKAADPHSGHDMTSMPGMDMPAGHDMSAMPDTSGQQADPNASHDMGAMPGMEMPGHDMSAMGQVVPAGTDLPAGSAPPPPVPVNHAADAVYGAQGMEMGRHHLSTMHGGQKFSQLMFNLAEAQFRNGRTAFEWNAQAWYGGDIDRLWIKSEGDGQFGRSIERAEVQALYSHAIGPYFNLQGGVRYDVRPNPSRIYAAVGIEGLAPRFFEVEGTLFLSNKGEVLARAEGYYDQRITQRLILQPRAELNFAAQNMRETRTGAGLSDAEIGLRLRYDIRREFAPYVGVQYRRAFGNTRHFLREAGEEASGWSLLTGVRVWF
jgi:copper resistance protein B